MEVKNMLYAGLGIGNMVQKKTYEHYKKMIEEGKVKDSAMGSALENFFDSIDDQSKEVKDKMVELFGKIADKLGYVKLNDYEYLQKRIKTLEADLAKAKNDKN